MQRGKTRNPITVALLMVFTFHIYTVYWVHSIVHEINAALGCKRFNLAKEVTLVLLTFGIWSIDFHRRLAEAILELEQSWGVESTTDLPSLMLLPPFSIQSALNNIWEKGHPPSADNASGHN